MHVRNMLHNQSIFKLSYIKFQSFSVFNHPELESKQEQRVQLSGKLTSSLDAHVCITLWAVQLWKDITNYTGCFKILPTLMNMCTLSLSSYGISKYLLTWSEVCLSYLYGKLGRVHCDWWCKVYTVFLQLKYCQRFRL